MTSSFSGQLWWYFLAEFSCIPGRTVAQVLVRVSFVHREMKLFPHLNFLVSCG